MPKTSRPACIALVALGLVAPAISEPLDFAGVVVRVLEHQPRLSEDSIALEQAGLQEKGLLRQAILPKLEVQAAFGPAPGFRWDVDETGDSVRNYAWWPLGPYFGTEISVAQPLNFERYRSGVRAARANVGVAQAKLQAQREGEVREALEYWLSWQYANRMAALLEKAVGLLDSAQGVLQQKLDDGDDAVSQDDLFQFRTSRYPLDKGLDDARIGCERAARGLRFALGMDGDETIEAKDSLLRALPELPPLDTLLAEFHPADLDQLSAGLEARRSLVSVKRAELGPELFVFAKLEYTKAWVSNRDEQNSDVLITDPLNSVSGAVGIGFKWKLNFWSQSVAVRKAELDYEELRRKDSYARQGLELKLADAYDRYRALGRQAERLQENIETSEEWLKSVVLAMDIDPSAANGLVGPYKSLVDFQTRYWETIHQRNLLSLDILRAAGQLVSEGGP